MDSNSGIIRAPGCVLQQSVSNSNALLERIKLVAVPKDRKIDRQDIFSIQRRDRRLAQDLVFLQALIDRQA